jgi:hypothetical protein
MATWDGDHDHAKLVCQTAGDALRQLNPFNYKTKYFNLSYLQNRLLNPSTGFALWFCYTSMISGTKLLMWICQHIVTPRPPKLHHPAIP